MDGPNKNINRRDFLKMVGAGSIALALDPVIRAVAKDQEVSSKIEPIETTKATYYPIFERHDVRPSYATDLARIYVTPDVHFVESIVDVSAADFQANIKPADALTLQTKLYDGSLSPILDQTSLVLFAKGAVNVAFEGIKMPQSNLSVTDQAVSFVADVISTVAMTFNGKADAQKLWETQQKLSHAVPENLLVLFRTCYIARKLQALGSYYNKILGIKPQISFNAGFNHQEIVKLLKQDESVTLEVFSQFSKEDLRRIINENGGIEALTRTMVLPTGKILIDNQDTKLFVDDIALQKRLLELTA